MKILDIIIFPLFLGLIAVLGATLVAHAIDEICKGVIKRDGKWHGVFARGLFFGAVLGYICYLPSEAREGGDGLYHSGEVIEVENSPEEHRKTRGLTVFFLVLFTTVHGIVKGRKACPAWLFAQEVQDPVADGSKKPSPPSVADAMVAHRITAKPDNGPVVGWRRLPYAGISSTITVVVLFAAWLDGGVGFATGLVFFPLQIYALRQRMLNIGLGMSWMWAAFVPLVNVVFWIYLMFEKEGAKRKTANAAPVMPYLPSPLPPLSVRVVPPPPNSTNSSDHGSKEFG